MENKGKLTERVTKKKKAGFSVKGYGGAEFEKLVRPGAEQEGLERPG
jgi:hypothetical protein